MVWWIASWAEDEQLQGEERIPKERCSCVWRACVVYGGLNNPPSLAKVVVSPIYRGAGPLPKY